MPFIHCLCMIFVKGNAVSCFIIIWNKRSGVHLLPNVSAQSYENTQVLTRLTLFHVHSNRYFLQ